jgi:hypothetical protein
VKRYLKSSSGYSLRLWHSRPSQSSRMVAKQLVLSRYLSQLRCCSSERDLLASLEISEDD